MARVLPHSIKIRSEVRLYIKDAKRVIGECADAASKSSECFKENRFFIRCPLDSVPDSMAIVTY